MIIMIPLIGLGVWFWKSLTQPLPATELDIHISTLVLLVNFLLLGWTYCRRADDA